MKKRERTLWMQALQNHAKAYRRLGMMYLKRGVSKENQELARLCLERSMEMGDEKGYFLFHKIFSKGQKVIDDSSYEAMWREYLETGKEEERKKLKQYLELGTKEQKRKVKEMRRKRMIHMSWIISIVFLLCIGIQAKAERYSWGDGIEFEGNVMDGKREGYGIQYGAGEALQELIEAGMFSNHIEVKGFWYDDFQQGPGVITDHDNNLTYEGFWENGELIGAGVFRLGNKKVTIASNFEDGFLVTIDEDGTVLEAVLYEGKGDAGKEVTLERWTDEDGVTYYAESSSEFIGGKGMAVYPDTGLYMGEFLNGEREGRGISYEWDGYWYAGNWKGGERSGVGAYYFPQDRQDLMICSVGIFQNEQMQGGSVEYGKDGSRIVSIKGSSDDSMMVRIKQDGSSEIWKWKTDGTVESMEEKQWTDGAYTYAGEKSGEKIDGYGVEVSSGAVYIGEFSDGKKDGKGYLYQLTNSLCYDGEWVGGKRDGTGTEYMAESYWSEGIYTKGESQKEETFWTDGSWRWDSEKEGKNIRTLVLTLDNGSRTVSVMEDGVQIIDDNGNIGVTVYKDAAYTGFSAVFEPGEYDMEDLVRRGISKDCITSIKVPEGYKIIVYHNDHCIGIRHPYTQDIDFSDIEKEDHTRWNDSITSFTVEKVDEE